MQISSLMPALRNPPINYASAYESLLDMYVLFVQLMQLILEPTGTPAIFNDTREILVLELESLTIRLGVLLP